MNEKSYILKNESVLKIFSKFHEQFFSNNSFLEIVSGLYGYMATTQNFWHKSLLIILEEEGGYGGNNFNSILFYILGVVFIVSAKNAQTD